MFFTKKISNKFSVSLDDPFQIASKINLAKKQFFSVLGN